MGKRVGLGIVFLILGIGFLLQQLDVFYFKETLSTWWPLILIVIGLIQLVGSSHSSKLPGIFFILLGAIFLSRELFDIDLFTYIWPLFLIIIGLVFIFSRGHFQRDISDSNNVIRHFSLFSGASVRSRSTHFEGGDVTAIFGGVKVDLRDIHLSLNNAFLDIVTAFGGATLIVPEGMRVEVTGTPILGGWENKTRGAVSEDESDLVLYVKCLPIFGGVEIKN